MAFVQLELEYHDCVRKIMESILTAFLDDVNAKTRRGECAQWDCLSLVEALFLE